MCKRTIFIAIGVPILSWSTILHELPRDFHVLVKYWLHACILIAYCKTCFLGTYWKDQEKFSASLCIHRYTSWFLVLLVKQRDGLQSVYRTVYRTPIFAFCYSSILHAWSLSSKLTYVPHKNVNNMVIATIENFCT